MNMKKIGVLYFNPRHFSYLANKTVGFPGVGPDAGTIFANRRKATSNLSEIGEKAKQDVINEFKNRFNVDIRLSWNIHAGCSMCPCSPGFEILIPESRTNFYGKLREERKISVWMTNDEKVDIKEPEFGFNQVIKPELEPQKD